MDEIFLLGIELVEVVKDIAQEQQKRAGKHHPQMESLMDPGKREKKKKTNVSTQLHSNAMNAFTHVLVLP